MLKTLRCKAFFLLVVFCGLLALGTIHALAHPGESTPCELIKCVETPQLKADAPRSEKCVAVVVQLVSAQPEPVYPQPCYSSCLSRAPPSPCSM